MSETFCLSDYQIRIGNEDVIERHLHGILSDDPERVARTKKRLKRNSRNFSRKCASGSAQSSRPTTSHFCSFESGTTLIF